MSGEQPVAVITGGGRGIGAAIATELASRGLGLVLIARSQGQLDEVAAELRHVTEVVTVSADVADPSSPERVMAAATDRFGRIDVLVNNAGFGPQLRLLDATDQEIDRVFAVNLLGPIRMAREAARAMPGAGGRIINISSIFSSISRPGFSLYTTTKAGLEAATKALAVEWATRGIAVNAVAPGHTETDLLEAVRADEALYRRMLEDIPFGRMGLPAEIANVVAYLAIDAPAYMTGSIVTVDGGELLV